MRTKFVNSILFCLNYIEGVTRKEIDMTYIQKLKRVSQTAFGGIVLATAFALGPIALNATAMAAETSAGATAAFQVQNTTDGRIRAGVKAYNKGKYKRAVSFNQAALKANLSNKKEAIAQSNLCASYAALGHMSKAEAACEAALELRPGYEPAKANSAALHIKLAALDKL